MFAQNNVLDALTLVKSQMDWLVARQSTLIILWSLSQCKNPNKITLLKTVALSQQCNLLVEYLFISHTYNMTTLL